MRCRSGGEIHVKAFVEWVRSIRERTQTTDSDPVESPTQREQTMLYHCPECGTVYVAIDKASCSRCLTEVEQVSPTLEEI